MRMRTRVKRFARRLLRRPVKVSARPNRRKKVETEYPFIYIAALRRTGSKLLTAGLTEIPHSFVFREPGFPRGCRGLIEKRYDGLPLHHLDLLALSERLEATGPSVKNAWSIVFREMLTVVHQVGVKEIRHRKWWKVTDYLDDVRFVVTARDPRDIYLSLCHKSSRDGLPPMRRGENPGALAAYIRSEFAYQQAMMNHYQAIKVRYEDLCTNPHIYEEIKTFVNSPIPRSGDADVDINARTIPRGEIRTDRVAVWQNERNHDFLENAHRVYDLVPEYNQFWDYAPNGFDVSAAVATASASTVESVAT